MPSAPATIVPAAPGKSRAQHLAMALLARVGPVCGLAPDEEARVYVDGHRRRGVAAHYHAEAAVYVSRYNGLVYERDLIRARASHRDASAAWRDVCDGLDACLAMLSLSPDSALALAPALITSERIAPCKRP